MKRVIVSRLLHQSIIRQGFTANLANSTGLIFHTDFYNGKKRERPKRVAFPISIWKHLLNLSAPLTVQKDCDLIFEEEKSDRMALVTWNVNICNEPCSLLDLPWKSHVRRSSFTLSQNKNWMTLSVIVFRQTKLQQHPTNDTVIGGNCFSKLDLMCYCPFVPARGVKVNPLVTLRDLLCVSAS